ncbi:MAG TPA: tRNA (adenosine(37)-N6)-threonylcarbamoyltransferase complex transferase subunit TsaD [Gemmatimonadota bacterium]|nr:tRNA (adenosine(37)-N6)-threonylcarbamoyltransferase complex transferase subunit TsaD [Gemmatimonadota bacterium]
MLTLGIETSCDDTSIALLEDETALRANVVSSQVVHAGYGGVVPELASRAHVSNILPIFERALGEAGVDAGTIDLIGVTHAPGLAGSLLVGGAFAQGLSLALDRAIVPVHHLEAHIVAILLERPDLELPALALVVSGGHTLLVHVRQWRQYEVIGRTRDDAAGEAFDKVAKLLGLGFPGGPAIEREARAGNPRSIDFPRPMLASGDHDFSFSGLKTAVLQWIEGRDAAELATRRADVCAAFQAAVVEVLVEKTGQAAEELGVPTVILAGGVACNGALREAMRARIHDALVVWPAPVLCTDNGAMIARTAVLRRDEAVRPGDFDVHASLPFP